MFKRSLVNTWVQIMAKGIIILISLVTTGILTRRLGANVYGSYALITSILLLLDSLADFGTKVIGVKEAAAKEGEERKRVFIQAAWTRLIMSLVALVLGLILIFSWPGFAEIKFEVLVALLMITFTSIAGSMEIVFQTELKMGLKVVVDILFPLLFLITLIFWSKPISLIWVFSIYLLARILSLVVGFSLVKRLVKIRFELIDKKLIVDFLKNSWPMGIYLLVFTGYDRAIDSLMIDRFVGIKEVAFYALAYKIYSNMVQPAYYFINSIFPILASKNENKKRLFKLANLTILGSLLIIIPLSYLLAPLMIRILGSSSFDPSIMVLRILLIALIFSYLNHLYGFNLIAKGGQKQLLFLGVTTLLFNFFGNLLMIPRFGINGAALVTALSEALAFLLTLVALKRR